MTLLDLQVPPQHAHRSRRALRMRDRLREFSSRYQRMPLPQRVTVVMHAWRLALNAREPGRVQYKGDVG